MALRQQLRTLSWIDASRISRSPSYVGNLSPCSAPPSRLWQSLTKFWIIDSVLHHPRVLATQQSLSLGRPEAQSTMLGSYCPHGPVVHATCYLNAGPPHRPIVPQCWVRITLPARLISSTYTDGNRVNAMRAIVQLQHPLIPDFNFACEILPVALATARTSRRPNSARCTPRAGTSWRERFGQSLDPMCPEIQDQRCGHF